MDCAVIEVSEKEEIALNIFLNNEKAQGYFDEEMLAKALKEVDYNPATGFDSADIEIMFGVQDSAEATTALDMVAKDIEKMGQFAPPEKAKPEGKTGQDTRFNPYTDNEEGVSDANHNITASATDSEHYLYLVFRTGDERERYLRLMGEPEDQKYVNGTRLLKTLEDEEAKRGKA